MYNEELGLRWDPTLTSQERCAIVARYAKKFRQVRNFVETGTASGETVEYVYDYFDNLYTIEIVPSLFKQTKATLGPTHPNIHFYIGDSTEVLPPLLAEINDSCMFWLDGHYCGSLETRGSLDTPIVQELEIIMATGRPHVIIIDDARLFGRDPAYPTVDWVRNYVSDQDIDYYFSYDNDMMRVIPKAWQ